MKPNFYKQTDSRWSSKRYRTTDGGYPSVGGAGCGPTSVCNVVSALTKPSLTPKQVFKYFCKKGYMTGNSGSYWSAIPAALKHYGIKAVETISHTANGKKKLKTYLESGYWAIAIMHRGNWTNGGHYILAYKVKGEYVYISDPASYSSGRAKNKFNLFWEQSDCDWCVIDPGQYATGTTAKTTTTSLMYVSDSYANVRKGRGTGYKVVGKLDFNTSVYVTGYKDNWFKIAKSKLKGYYIHEHTLSKYKQNKCKFKTLEKMNVRAGYSAKTDVIGSAAKGKIIASTKQRGRWAYIPAKKGWVCIKSKDGDIYLKEV